MRYVNQGYPGQLPLTVHIQLFQPAYSSDKERGWKWLPLGSSPQPHVFQGIQDGWIAFFPLSFPTFFLLGPDLSSLGARIASCWVKESREYEREPLKMKPVGYVIGNTPSNKRTNTLQIECSESKGVHLKYSIIKPDTFLKPLYS